MKKHCLVFWVLIAINPIYAQTLQIYKWTDPNGSVHFSDKPHDGAEQIKLPKVQSYSAPKVEPSEKSSDAVTDIETRQYEKINIAQPEDQVTIRNTEGFISVILELKPKLMDGDKVQIMLDGDPIGDPEASSAFTLRDIKRGSHTLVAKVVDIKGKLIASSDLVTIYMMPPRVGMGRNSP
jgi:hypothetical protein